MEISWKAENRGVLDLKWVYTKKADNKFKARIVVRFSTKRSAGRHLFASRENADAENSVKILCTKRICDRSNGCRVSILKRKNKVRSICKTILRLRW